jgi:catechol 2,3-dioxygenase-like lactoylglutathione lyase family enzyme
MFERLQGVHHVGMGVMNYQIMKDFYSNILEMKTTLFEFRDSWNVMPEVFRTSLHKLDAILFVQEVGGIVIELVALSIPLPRPIRKDKKYGDIGVNKITLAVDDADKFFREHKDKISFFSQPKSITVPGWGDYRFVYAKDPENNLIEFVSSSKLEVKGTFGGVRWLGVAVTDLERSMEFYQSYAFDQVVIAPHEAFSGMINEASGAPDTKVRSCLLANSKGGGWVELYELLKPRGRSIPLNTYWGDAGFLEVALMTDDIQGLGSYCRERDMFYMHHPVTIQDSDGHDASFQYIYDPDGIPIETVA